MARVLRALKKNSILICIGLVTIGALCAGFVLKVGTDNHNGEKTLEISSKKAVLRSRHSTTMPFTPKYENSIQKAEAYLTDNFDQISPEVRLILDYLDRKFAIGYHFNVEKSPIVEPKEGDHVDLGEFKALKRIAYPDELVEKLELTDKDLQTQMMVAAANCDHIALPGNFEQIIRANIQAGGYQMTHAAFSLKRMKENNCSFNREIDLELHTEVALNMVEIAQDMSGKPDLRYEAIAFLMDMDRRDLVEEKWIDRLVEEQQGDGGWKTDKEIISPEQLDHTTTLALWALLEYSRPGAPTEPMILH